MTRALLSRSLSLSLATSIVVLGACPPPTGEDAGPATDAGPDDDTDAGDGDDDAGAGGTDAGPDPEPDELAPGDTVAGSIFEPQDQDVFYVDSAGGTPYRVSLTLPAGSALQGHLTVFDDGRDGAITGDDYAQLSIGGVNADVELEFLAMGEGHYIAVRDARNVGGGATAGGFDHTYEVTVEELTLDDVVVSDVAFPSTLTGTLPHPSAMHVYRFSTDTDFEEVAFDFSTTGNMDGRLYVVAASTGDWIARNDDRVGSADPLIEAPMTETGTLYLVVENIALEATGLSYSIAASKP